MRRMPVRRKVAFGGYLVIALAAVGVGLRYLLSSRIMPYHQLALGVPWDDLAPRERLLLLALLKGIGLCALVTGLVVGTLLIVPFRRGERWARWAIAGLCLTTLVPAACIAVSLAAATGAATPWPILVAGIVQVFAGFLLSAPDDVPITARSRGNRPDAGVPKVPAHPASPRLSVLDRPRRQGYPNASIGLTGRVVATSVSALRGVFPVALDPGDVRCRASG